MADFVASLVEMEFSRDKASEAVEVTRNQGVAPTMEWVLQNPESYQPGSNKAASETPSETGFSNKSKSCDTCVCTFTCEDCGELLKDVEALEFHGAKTNHLNFCESAEEKDPLTPEELAEHFRRLNAELKDTKNKRLKRENLEREKREDLEREKREDLEREKREDFDRGKSRVAMGKELAEAKRRLQEQEMKEIAEARRREKIDDRMARERVKAQIEQDKLTRKATFEQQDETMELPPPNLVVAAAEPAASPQKKDYKETKVQPTVYGLPQCFKCGKFCHYSSSCPNAVDHEARKIIKKDFRTKRTSKEKNKYKAKYLNKRQTSDEFNGDTQLLRRTVDLVTDELIDSEEEIMGIPIDRIRDLAASSIQLEKLKSRLESRLKDWRSLIYVSKKYSHRIGNKDECNIFECRVDELEMLRNKTWNEVWKKNHHAQAAFNLMQDTQEEKSKLMSILNQVLLKTIGIPIQKFLKMFEDIKIYQFNIRRNLTHLQALCNDDAVAAEMEWVDELVTTFREYAAARANKNEGKRKMYENTLANLNQNQTSPF